jgi:hypothetical protein
MRLLAAAVYVLRCVPVYRRGAREHRSGSLALGIILLLAGHGWTIFFPANRIAILHLTLIGGFNVITFAVANSRRLWAQRQSRPRHPSKSFGSKSLVFAPQSSNDVEVSALSGRNARERGSIYIGQQHLA